MPTSRKHDNPIRLSTRDAARYEKCILGLLSDINVLDCGERQKRNIKVAYQLIETLQKARMNQ